MWRWRYARRGLGRLGGLPADQIRTYAANAGFVEPDLTTAVAIALAESGGNPSAYNPEPQANTPIGKGSVGLWQIYLYKHPEFAGQNLLHPQTNANDAYLVYAKARGFYPWTTYGSGAYTSYLAQAAPADTVDATAADYTTAPDLSTPPADSSQLLGLTAIGLGAFLAADFLFGD